MGEQTVEGVLHGDVWSWNLMYLVRARGEPICAGMAWDVNSV
jgi:hypothetical protein